MSILHVKRKVYPQIHFDAINLTAHHVDDIFTVHENECL